MSEDIANRLRNKHADDLLAWEAVAEIERLRTEIERLRTEIERLRELSGEAGRLREERDQARRLVCRHTKKTYRTLKEMAEERGWDCFGENSDAQ